MKTTEQQLEETRAELERVKIIALMSLGALMSHLGQGHDFMPHVKAWSESLGVEWRYGPVGPEAEQNRDG